VKGWVATMIVHPNGHIDSETGEEDAMMFEYALRWVNSGGGPDTDIEARFDMTARTFYRHVLRILERCPGHDHNRLGLSPVLAARILAVARHRIWLSRI
jgi:hypothetical protein